jgi:urea transport system permease protein
MQKSAARWLRRRWLLALVVAVLSGTAAQAQGPTTPTPADLPGLVRALGDGEPEAVARAIAALGERGDAAALPALEALYDDRLRVGPDGSVFVEQPKTRTLVRPLDGAPVSPAPSPLRSGEMNNEIRRTIVPVIARLKLRAPDPAVRLAAAQELSRRGGEDVLPLLRAARDRETDPAVKDALSIGLARSDLRGADSARKRQALEVLQALGTGEVKGEIEALLAKSGDRFSEPDPQVREAAEAALGSIRNRERMINAAGHILYGLSLASVFLFAALGLAITFGVMGVINMAHGEMLTIGAYSAYVVQVFFQKNFPGAIALYPLVAIPVAFVAAGGMGVLLERSVIRWLYGRPLETLLATWGISLGLIQSVRLLFGASNVAVENPPWLAGGVELLHGLVLPYSRVAVVFFVVLAALLVWFLLHRTRLGLTLRAVTQNRAMAACMGVRTGRVDMWTFGLGSGIAGLGGVALSQLGNVGPELGQSYILDSFMVVVLGGVGRIAGTIGAALGLGIVQKMLEPLSGAVLGKIAVLVVIILFIQRRPQGMFPLKGRVEV